MIDNKDKILFNHKSLHDPLQALAYWLGYEHKRYRFYEIREIAIANELVHLIEANIKQLQFYIDCEVPYYAFSKEDQKAATRGKADIAIFSLSDDKKDKSYQAIIEVKRLKARKRKIEADINRIHEALTKSSNPFLSGFVIACSPGPLHSTMWLTDKRKASRKLFRTENKGAPYRVRRVVHAYPSFQVVTVAVRQRKKGGGSKPLAGFHVVLLEVLNVSKNN
jgi:hypothetical protein